MAVSSSIPLPPWLALLVLAGFVWLTPPARAAVDPPGPAASNTDTELRFHSGSTADYGSGASIRPDWYQPGGLSGGIGIFVGHPNGLSRSDRALVRFDLARLLPLSVAELEQRTATLRFRVARVAGSAPTRRIEVSYLSYDPWNLTGEDLVKNSCAKVEVVRVRQTNFREVEYAVDVTQVVRQGLAQGNKFCGFRFRDVTAEKHGNPDMMETGVELSFQDQRPELAVSKGL